jgi:sugar lactone lactonase YvrE
VAVQEKHDFADLRCLLPCVRDPLPALGAFTVPVKDLIPEGIAVDPSTRTFYMGSLFRKKIVRVRINGEVTDFTERHHAQWGPLCGVKVDSSDHSVWANTCDDSGVAAELLHFGRHGGLEARFPAAQVGKHLFNDLVLHGHSEIYLTDSLANQVYRFNRKSRTFTPLSFPRPMYYPNGIALSADGNQLYVADLFGMFLFDLRDGVAREVKTPQSNTLATADGLYWYKGSLVAVQNGLGLPRVAEVQLSADGWHATRVDILEYRSPLVTSPTTGAILGSDFYFISNTQIDNLRDGKIVDQNKLQPILISALPLCSFSEGVNK